MPKQVKVPQSDGWITITQGNPYQGVEYEVVGGLIAVEDGDVALVLDHISGAEVVDQPEVAGSPSDAKEQ